MRSSISILVKIDSNILLDPNELAVGKFWRAFHCFRCFCYAYTWNSAFITTFLFYFIAKLKFGTCKLLLTLVPQQVHYACVH